MTAETQARLDRLRNRTSRYELAIRHPDGRGYLIAYTSRRSRQGLWAAVTAEDRVHRLVKLTGSPEITFAKRAADGATMGAWAIRFTGRTQRDCILGTGGPELPYVGDLPAE